jgi:thiamine-phosphate pyrophosphorylase
MKFDRNSLLLYAVTDRYWLKEHTLLEEVENTLKGGATFIQLREKNLSEDKFLKEAVEIQALCKKYNVPFVVNDNVDIAVSMGADGVHVGQSDMEAGQVRAKLGEGKIIGVSASTVEQAVLAQKRGADYLGVGAIFPTGSKDDADAVSIDTLKAIVNAVSIPVVAIGGITKENVCELKDSGIAGIAVISAIFAKPDVKAATTELRSIMEKLKA